MKQKFIFFIAAFTLFTINSYSQKKLVIMGSSTALGVGASVYDSAWGGRITQYFNQNSSDGIDTICYNIAGSGYGSYQEMPTTYVHPSDRPEPDEDFNVTKALSFNPDVVIINLPSNDINYGYAKYETMRNFRTMYAYIISSGAKCYFTTPQPRNDFTASMRDSLVSMIDSVNNEFGPYAINFWSDLVTNDGLYSLRDEYRATGSPIHVNNAGHEILFRAVRDKFVFGFGSPLPLSFTDFQAQLRNKAVSLTWHTELQDANTNFEIQRSGNAIDFEKISGQYINEPRQSSNYSGVDASPLPGKSFYRIKISQLSRSFYSPVADINNKDSDLGIIKFYKDNTGSNLIVEIGITKSQPIVMRVIDLNGAVLISQKQYIESPSKRITISINNISKGQYYLTIQTNTGEKIVRAFVN